MKRFLLGTVVALAFAGPVAAESLIVEYFTSLRAVDTYNSNGAPLNDFCAIVQQDRANVNRFNKANEADQRDRFFTTSERRAMIAGNCDYDRSYYSGAAARLRNGSGHYVYVRVYGNGDQVTRVSVQEGAG